MDHGGLARGLRVVFVVALVFALVMALLPHPPSAPAEVGDKAQHTLAFVVLSALAAAGWPRASLPRIGERLSFVGALIEVFQSIPALGRDCDVWDWVTDTVAIAATLLIVRAVRGRRAPG